MDCVFRDSLCVVVDGIKDIMAYLAPCPRPRLTSVARESQKFRICRQHEYSGVLMFICCAGIANNIIFFLVEFMLENENKQDWIYTITRAESYRNNHRLRFKTKIQSVKK